MSHTIQLIFCFFLLSLLSCTPSQVEQELRNTTIPQQYVVKTTMGGDEISYVVRQERFVACQGTIAGSRCTPETLERYGLTLTDITELIEKRNVTFNGSCFQSDGLKACRDGNGVITSFTNGSNWLVTYVPPE